MDNERTAEELRGKWVILMNRNIIASGKDIKKLIEEAKKKYPTEKLVLAKVPDKGTLIY